MFQPVNLSCYDKSQQAQGKLPVCQYWHEEDTLSDMTDIKYYDQKYLKQLMNGLDFVLRVFSKKESSESALVFVYDKVTNLYDLRQLGSGSGGKDYSKEIESLENAVSVLTTSVELSTEIGQTTTVLLDELLTLGVDGRPDYKVAGATVYAENGVTGIIDTIDNSMQTATIKTVSVSTCGASLPDQTDNAGKFLMTDGVNVSWGNAITNKAKQSTSFIFSDGGSTDTKTSVVIGVNASTYADRTLALGYNAQTNAMGAIQLNASLFNRSNSDANTFKVGNGNGNFEIMSADGTIPAERLTKILQDKTSDNTVLQFGDKVIQSGVITIGVVNPNVANSNNPVSLAVAMDMTTPYTIICTPSNTAEAFDRLIADYGNQTANGFEICVRNLSEDTAAANVVVSWMVIGKVSG